MREHSGRSQSVRAHAPGERIEGAPNQSDYVLDADLLQDPDQDLYDRL